MSYTETGFVSIEIVAKLHSVPLDINSIKKRYFIDDELKKEEIVRILRDSGFKVKLKKFATIENLQKYPVPLILISNDAKYHVLIGKKEDKYLLFDSIEKKVKGLTQEEFSSFFGGEGFILYPRITKTIFYLNFKWLFKEFFRFKAIFSEILFASFLIQLFGLVTPLFIQVIIDKVLVHQALTTLQVVATVFLVVTIFDWFITMMRNYLLYHTANKIDASLGAKVFRHLLSIPFRYFETRRVGDIIARVRELENLRQFMTNISLTVLLDTLFSVVFVVIMTMYSVKLTLLVMGFIFLIGLISFFTTPLIKARIDDKFEKGARSQSFLVESITGVQTIKSLAIEGKMMKDWENYLGEYILSAFKLSNLGNISFSSSKMLQKIMTLAIIYFGVGLVFENKLSVGQLIAFQMFSSQLSSPILRLVQLWQEFQQAKLSLEKLGDIVNTPPEVKGEAVSVKELLGDIVFKEVQFKYAADGPVILEKVNIKIDKGMMVGVVGRSGSGKSTLAKLVQRLHLPTEGAIYIDGIDVRHMDPMFLRYRIGMVPQECFLFSGSIKENITIAMPDASMDKVINVSKIAGAHEFISELEMGYDTYVEERGTSLSGGQKQRVSIARALITDPRIVIFDEATSALDYESEKIIHKNLQFIRKGRTVIMIAHRLSTLRKCDNIIVLDKGQVMEAGSHDALLKKNGLYAYLYKQQEAGE
ncbi:MAG: type I secretion system permease/ATPase [Nitrospinota bacterium]|nr:type I secretion system permease/ATPase [Nitrospinota bacterium]